MTENKPRINVGRAALEGNLVRYARVFNLLEVRSESGRHPRRPGLLKWRESVGEDFVFAVVVPSSLSALETTADGAFVLQNAKMVADALSAQWWLLRTPPTVTPSPRARRRLDALIESLRAEGRSIAWDARGVWEERTAMQAAANMGVSLVRDLAREERLDDGPVAYTRLRALGEGARIGAAAAERVVERLDGVLEANVVVEGAGAGRVRQLLREAFALSDDDEAEAGAPIEDDEDEAEAEAEEGRSEDPNYEEDE